MEKSDKRRGLVKNTMYGKMYGAGVTKMAETAGVPYDQMNTKLISAAGSETGSAPTEASTWTRIIDDEGDLQMANPDVDTASRLAFHASRVGQPARIGLETGERLIFLSRFAAPSVNKLFEDYASDPRKNTPFPASEQEIATFNKEHDDLPPLRAVLPEKEIGRAHV